MNTLHHTIRRLQSLSIRSPRMDAPAEGGLEALVAEIEHLASEPLFKGRPTGPTGFQSEWQRAQANATSGLPDGLPLTPSELVGVEVLEGRFESTNDRLVGVYEEPRMRSVGLDWSPQVLKELLTGHPVTPLTTPIMPFALTNARARLYQAGGQLGDEPEAREAAEQLRFQILAMIAASVGAQANTSERVVSMLTR